MTKLLGSILVLLSCIIAGGMAAEEKKERLKSLRWLRQFFLALQGEIRYGGIPLAEAIQASAGNRAENALSLAFLRMVERMEQKNAGSFSGIWKEELKKTVKTACLKEKDMERLLKTGESLGYLDRETQLESLTCYLSEISNDIEAEERIIGEKVRLCRWMGALSGIFICILMA